MVLGPLIGAAAGIIGALSQQQAANDATQLGYANLNFQKENAAKQFDLSTASRPDAFGNVTSYDPIQNEWEFNMTPQQQAILDAFQQEQQLSLTEDAQRKRDLSRTQEQRAKEAKPLYEEAVREYTYSPYKPGMTASKENMDAIQSAAIARNQANRAQAQALQTTAIRQGQGADVAKIMAGGRQVSGDQMIQDILQAKKFGEQQHASNVVNWENMFKPRIDMFRGIMDDVSTGGRIDPTSPQSLGQTQQSIASAIQQALGSASAGIGNAYTNAATLAGQGGLDLSAVANALSRWDPSGSGDPNFNAPVVQPLYPSTSVTPGFNERIEPGPRNPDYGGY